MSMKLKALIQPDEADKSSQPNRKLQIFVIAVIAICVFGGAQVLAYAPGRTAQAAEDDVGIVVPSPTPIVVTATPTATLEPTVTPNVVFRDATPVLMEVTRVVEQIQYIEVPVEVTRIVETRVEVTSTPAPMAGGSVRVCVDAAGVREIYVDGFGIVGGGCREFVVGVGASQIPVQINR